MKYAAAACATLLSGLCGLLVLYWLFPALLFMTYFRKLLSWGVSLEYQFVALCFSIFSGTFGSVLGAYCILVRRFGQTAHRVRERLSVPPFVRSGPTAVSRSAPTAVSVAWSEP
jgi:hypothetical protein